MKKAIVTRSDDNIEEIKDISHPIIAHFAKKWKADFIELSENINTGDELAKRHYRILELKDVLDDYDRVLCIDSDVIISPKCMNLFSLVPEGKIGSIYEDKGSRKIDRQLRIAKAQKKWGNVGWYSGYINTGVFVVSKHHQDIFDYIDGELWNDLGYDDVHLGYQIHRKGYEIEELHFRYNHMTMFSEPWNDRAHRFNSFIVHYAGRGIFPGEVFKDRVENMRHDKEYFWDSITCF